MNPVLWTGNGASTINITGVGFQPDFVWAKRRTGGDGHGLFDAVRGVNLWIQSNTTGAETTFGGNFGLLSFNADGFTMGNGSAVNLNTESYVGWNWNAGGSTVTNTSGSISAQVRANPTAGFSIVTYTGNNTSGATVGHGLGATPAFVIVKKRSGAANWRVGTSASASAALPIDGYLNLTLGLTRDTSTFQSFSSTTLTLGNSDDVNGGSGGTYVAYCFTAVAGYSSIGSWTGNGSTDGTFVYTGFRPRYIMYKRTNASGDDWVIMDTARDPSNVATQELYADLSLAEGTAANNIDILSNGFKARRTQSSINASGGNYIYIAFAESPFKNALAR
jgi:hypothetical protein